MTDKMMLTCGSEAPPQEQPPWACATAGIDCAVGYQVHYSQIECHAETLEKARQLRDAVMLGMVRFTRLPPEQLLEIAESCQGATELVKHLVEFDLAKARGAVMAARAREQLRRRSADTVEQLEAVGWLLDELPALMRAYQALIKGLVQQETEQ